MRQDYCTQKLFLTVVQKKDSKLTSGGISTVKIWLLCTTDRKCEVAASSSSSVQFSRQKQMKWNVCWGWDLTNNHHPPKKDQSSFESLPATLFSPLGKNADRSLCDWKLCGNNASVPLRVLSRNTRSILFGFQQAKKEQKAAKCLPAAKRNATNWWIRGIASRWIYKGIVAVDCTVFQLLL